MPRGYVVVVRVAWLRRAQSDRWWSAGHRAV